MIDVWDSMRDSEDYDPKGDLVGTMITIFFLCLILGFIVF